MEILFITKKDDKNAQIASEYLMQIFPNSLIVFGRRGEKFPEDLGLWKGDYIFSYISPWIIPNSLLKRAEKGAINWHPGPPEYPGIGCTNFAIYNNEKHFGITCHYMLDKVDTGKIIEVKRFAVLENDTVFSITQKCYALIINSFYRILENISNDLALPETDENWKRKPFTRKELDELSEIKPDMSIDEIEKRIKATSYDRPWAFVDIKGKKFYLKEEII
jgi:methionyl-tRNA formyltransferase